MDLGRKEVGTHQLRLSSHSMTRIISLLLGRSIHLVSERSELDALSSDDKKKEMKKVYRKLKGVRCQVSMKLKELEKEAKEARFSDMDEELTMVEENAGEGSSDQGPVSDNGKRARGKVGEVQYEVRTLLGNKTRLRKRFQKLQEELGRNT
jgi:predicted nuclease with TOPRIM domain